MKKIAFYLRVSTAHQEKEQSIQTQLEKLKEKYKGEKMIKVYQDVCSGSYLQREGLNQLREDAKKGLFDVIGIYALDRLSRNLGHQIALLEEFEKQGIRVEVLGEDYGNSPEGILNRNIRGAFAEYERFRIAQRMKDGRYRKIENQEYAVGTSPYGYKIVKENGKARLEINPEEAKVVKAIFRIYLEEHSLGKTAERIYKMGYRSRTNKSFSRFMIGHFLKNETYIGNFYFGKTFACEPKNPIRVNKKSKTPLTSRKYNPKENWKLIKVPAIIDENTFNRVQEIRKEMARQSLKPTRHYLLQGLIKCPYCNMRYIGKMRSKSHRLESPNGSHFSYICPRKAGKRRPDDYHCPSREISTKRLDFYVWEYVSALIRDKDKLINSIKLLREKRESEKDFNKRVYDGLLEQKAKIKQKKSKLLKLFTDDKIRKDDLEREIVALNNEEDYLENQLKEAERKLLEVKETASLEEEIERTCLEYQSKIENADFDLKRRILNKWVKEIILPKDGSILIKVRIPQPENPQKIQFSSAQYVRTGVSVSEEVWWGERKGLKLIKGRFLGSKPAIL
jgi:site-specific DNA recombinase